MDLPPSFDKLLNHLEDVELTTVHGRITEVIGMLIRAVVPQVKMGEVCLIKREGEPLATEVVGFTKDEVILSPLGDMKGIGPSSEVIPLRMPMHIKVGPKLLGRVLNGLGQPIDEDSKGPLDTEDTFAVINPPPDPLQRSLIDKPLSVGVRCIDGILTVGKGQRVGIFSAAGVGKSTLLGMIARNAVADVNVISLIGERGRELREFLINDLGEEGMKRSVVIVSTSDQAAQMRLNAAYVGTAIAEYFREQGKSVILMMDSVTRFARALREIGLAAGEPPARAGYTPSVFAILPRLLERSGNSNKGSITAFYTVLVAGDDLNEPVADEVRSILDGHIILSTELARQYHYPAIDVLASISRVLTQITDRPHQELIGKIREVLANYKKNELLIRIGEYKPGSDKNADFSLKYIDKVNRFLRQQVGEKCSFEETLRQLKGLFT
ncbi:MAG: flagellum-specific ATP synthase FliI [Chlamydiae bacterium RIFCSPHIGHO2_12_FULL_44_59]|nr:MAG: flagellum-specific ATP synthase FliI [Chlamydiae bacterium RIFCSPHIGHO2_01_FULL_44_39]OGN58309.1 MAG: flagellum-specific ATP synthase FliI [Chlamydiae bacterium RIFCSPHIGHO2_02_FULL_45_9]OGN60337.1 MAG: flagellum-specific ATP synthase FliI [Chlamydiae bacterium RIFCSPHIGHO2_12_FULL_44_59]OGN66320.1 MAG: flagellum-specific ATP synthase FliI [Chlamydiae bacterium RIFCSPLOWO2_01_FULL_44_52]OGN69271.1 MAG: flagellum-specific ATP synthase FliI [Chlamydiae bacterium RIFCSPLOWO2_02_FULL_45_22]